jgi:hypothetical protein
LLPLPITPFHRQGSGSGSSFICSEQLGQDCSALSMKGKTGKW